MSSPRLLLLLVALAPLSGCEGLAIAEAAEPSVPSALETWLPRFHVARFTRHEQYDALPPDIGHYRVTREVERIEPRRTVYQECEQRTDRKKAVDCLLTFAGVEGYGNAASPVRGEWEWWSPPQIILPPAPVAGAHWLAEHQKRGGSSRRECQILADATFCDGGIESRCFSVFPASSVGISQHYCPGVGWVGQDAFARYEDGHQFATFTLDVTLDGVPAPERRPPPTSERSTATW